MEILNVLLWGEEVGKLAWDKRRRLAYFTFNPEFQNKGVEPFPLVASAKEMRPHTPIWGERERRFQKLPSFLADSLPDDWGNQLFECWCREQHIAQADITPLEKLSFIGKRGMGALEFEPDMNNQGTNDRVDLQSLVGLSQKIFSQRESVRILPGESLTMQSLIAVGTSAGGRQPKVIVAVNRRTGEIRSGQLPGLEGYDYCIIKFGDEQYCSAELEMTYYEMALLAGIRMMPSSLIAVDGKCHFLTQRFDRQNGEKIHLQTLLALSPEADSYEDLLRVCRKLHLPEKDIEEVFRRLVFNHLSNNTDDHNKNFSFLMNPKGEWCLSPAYDMTFILNHGGYQPNREHCLFLGGKLADVSKEDVLLFAKEQGIRRPQSIIRQVASAIARFREIAVKHGVAEAWIGRVEGCLQRHFADWGLTESTPKILSYTDEQGRQIEHAHLEQAYKGNIHLLATIDGKERKYVIRRGMPEYDSIVQVGLYQIAEEELKRLVSEWLTRDE